MANEYIDKKVSEIISSDNFEYPLNLAMASAWILAEFKGVNLKIFDMSETSSLADYYILANASNPTQSRAMADELTYQLKKHNSTLSSVEGLQDAEWVLIDAGDIIVHVFDDALRPVYDLDGLWKDHPKVKIPEEYYFSSSDSENKVEETKGYF